MCLDSLISALRQEARRLDEVIAAVENLMDAHRKAEEAAAAFEGYNGARPTAPAMHRLHRHRN